MLGRPVPPDIPDMWKRDDSTRSGLQDAINRTRGELQRTATEDHPEAPPRSELPAPEPDHAARIDLTASSTMRANVATDSAALGLHPFLQGLLDVLPEPGTGWPVVNREQWLDTARSIFALIYGSPATPVARIPTPDPDIR